MRHFILLLLAIFAITGCKSSFKSNFRDFNAYYNTYYNAKKSYNRGLEKSLEQERTYNTLQPIRIYETPKGAGSTDFNNAIEKGASVLRKFDDTKWVDNALEIIGKSYYFRSEYFSAIQKFEELSVNTKDVELQQRSIYWKGRVLLELEAYNDGIQFLNEQLSLNDGEWKSKLEWQVKVVLAEHYIATENWVIALDLLNESVGKIPGRANNERGYFLIGQINERLSNPAAAFEAYDQVGRYYSNYDLQFEARKKKAEVARDLGDIDEAIKVFANMVRDDKNTDFISELNLELGKSEQLKGNSEKARDIFISILQDPINKPDNKTKALTYYGLAELYRFDFDNYSLAAAYYDSSANLNISSEELPEDYDARNLADSFGAYADLTFEVYELDSLLWLGSLSEEAFDSVIKEMEAQKLAEIERLREEQEQQRNTLLNVGGNNNQIQSGNSENGFLNIRNPLLITDASEQFRAIWGVRPLVDNWRVSSLIVNVSVDNNNQNGEENISGVQQLNTVDLSIDLSRIPFTQSDQDSLKDEIAVLTYELGNLFFLQLDQPDSANLYFNKVLESRPNSEVIPITLYSLSELFNIQGDEVQSRFYAEQLIDRFPETEFAQRVTTKFDLEIPDGQGYNEANPRDIFLDLLVNSELSDVEKAESLAELSIEFKEESFSDRALYESIQEYIRIAKRDSTFIENSSAWINQNGDWQKSLELFENEKDSVRLAFNDSSITKTAADSSFYYSLSDSVLVKPDLNSFFPYEGAMWDSVRAKINLFSATFGASTYSNYVNSLKAEFGLPKTEIVTEESELKSENISSIQTNSDYLNCVELNVMPMIRGGDDVLDEVLRFGPNLKEDTISFLFFINQRGIIDEFKLSSDTDNEVLISEYVDAIDRMISFEPILINGEAQKVACEIEFTIPK